MQPRKRRRHHRNRSSYEPLFTHSTFGGSATVTPGQNTMGSWADVYTTPLSTDYHAIRIFWGGIGVNAKITNSLYNFGWDPAGGTNYGASALTKIPYINMGYAGPTANAWCSCLFPVLIPAGSTLGAQGQINNATVATGNVWAILYRALSPKDAVFGTQVVSFGEQTTVSRGYDITGGSASEGTWTLAASSLTAPVPSIWIAQASPTNTASLSANIVGNYELGFGSSTANLREAGDRWYWSNINSAEQIVTHVRPLYCQPAVGDNMYIRARQGNASHPTIMVHGII